jgi:SAM-dependent methyltransferase
LEEWDELPASRFFRAGAAMPRLERVALAACRGPVLDVGAGAGCHALTLQRRGLAVTALDQSEGACRVMQARGVKDVRHGDWRAFGGSRYGTVLSLMNGLGLAADLAGLDAFLDAATAWLAPGGQLLVDSADLIYLYTVEHGGRYEDLRKAHYGEAVYRMHYGESVSPAFGWLFLDFETLKRRASQRGWEASCVHEGPFYAYLARLTKV